jgi:hypothetical protein
MPFDSERSTGALLLALIAVGLLSLGYLWPWLSYDDSTGRRTPPGGFHDPSDTGIEKHYIDFGPFAVTGDIAPSNPERADLLTLILGSLWVAAGAAFLLMAIAEIPPFTRFMGRTVSLVLCLFGLASLGTALWIAYGPLPHTMAGLGIKSAFTYELVEPNGYYRTTLGQGWIAAIASAPFALAAFAFKFQAGSADPSAIEAYGKSREAQARNPGQQGEADAQ